MYWNFLFVLKANTGAFGQLFLQFLPITNKSYSLLNRSLLLFAKGKPLGKKGFEWLKTHCINLTELKKKSPVAERLAYADEVMEDILDSANNPLNGKRWWVQAEDPWQCLASCIEIRNALNHPDGPEHYGTVYVFTEQF